MGSGSSFGQVPVSASGPSNNTYHQHVYSLYFNNLATGAAAPDEEQQTVYSTHVLPSTIQSVLYPTKPGGDAGIERYAISLPLPNAVTTYSGDWGPAVTDVKIDKNAIGSRSLAARYSTWTVLHYTLTKDLQPNDAVVILDSDGSPSSVPITFEKDRDDTDPSDNSNTFINRYGISVGLMEAPLCNTSTITNPVYYGTSNCMDFKKVIAVPTDDRRCDSLSEVSFALSELLWGLKEHARFPWEQDDEGTQNPGNFNYRCPEAYSGDIDALKANQKRAAERNIKVAPFANDIAKNISDLEEFLTRVGAGSNTLRSSHRLKGKQNEETVPLQLFDKISTDISSIYPSGIPNTVADAFFCACIDENQNSCPTLGSLKTKNDCDLNKTNAYLRTGYNAIDKGSSDCHAPQMNIYGAIQPQP
jgi:hypothetical protein